MTDRYSQLSPWLRALDRVTAPPQDDSAPIDHLVTAGVPSLGDLVKGGRSVARSVRDELGYGPSAQPHDGRGVPGKVPIYDSKTGKTTLVPDSPLPDVGFNPSRYDPQGGRNIVLPKMVSPEYGGTLGVDTDPNVTDVPKNVAPSAAAIGVRGATGGRMKGYAFGGGTPSMLAERGSMYNLRHEGFLNSAVAGRTDHIGLQVRNGSYVIPADVVSAAGQGNSLAGANAFDKLLKQGPYGSGAGTGGIRAPRPMMPQMPRMGMGMARPPGMGGNYNSNSSFSSSLKLKSPFAGGGNVIDAQNRFAPAVRTVTPEELQAAQEGAAAQRALGAMSPSQAIEPLRLAPRASGGPASKPRELVAPKEGRWDGLSAGGVSRPTGDSHIPILAAGGEYIVMPETVARIGNGDQQKGFKILDKLVLMTRKKHIETLKKLKPPKKK